MLNINFMACGRLEEKRLLNFKRHFLRSITVREMAVQKKTNKHKSFLIVFHFVRALFDVSSFESVK